MKLRNKKTGEIKDFGNLQVYAEKENTDDSQFLGNFSSFEQILEYYEDYKPAEPLIKDEKIRKAVRAWAEANGIKDIVCYATENGFKFAGNPISLEIRFNQTLEIYTDGIYTITELCGEDE